MAENNSYIETLSKDEFSFILQEGEGYLIEFKERIDKSLSKEITAFANASGGRIFVGVNDNNEPIGVSITNKVKSKVQDIAQNIQPAVNIKLTTFNNILIIEVVRAQTNLTKHLRGFLLEWGQTLRKCRGIK